jgi:hypothetical protein
MWLREHNPPHFHALHGEFHASFRIDDLSIDDGHLPPSIARLVRRWAVRYKEELADNWRRARDEMELRPIPPPEP